MERLLAIEGDTAGSEFRQEEGVGRLAALVGKDGPNGVFERLVSHEGVLSYVAAVLGATRLKLSSVNARVVPPIASGGGASDCSEPAGLQPLHADFSAVVDDAGPWVANVLIALAPCKTPELLLAFCPCASQGGISERWLVESQIITRPARCGRCPARTGGVGCPQKTCPIRHNRTLSKFSSQPSAALLHKQPAVACDFGIF